MENEHFDTHKYMMKTVTEAKIERETNEESKNEKKRTLKHGFQKRKENHAVSS